MTGAAQGLGQAFAVALARRGYRVAGLDLGPQPQTAAKVLDYVELTADTADEARLRAQLERAVDRFGTLHAVVNSAGTHPEGPAGETPPEEWRRVVRATLEAPYLVTRAALPHLKRAGWGRIVNVAPPAAPSAIPYLTSAAGLTGLTRALAPALAPYGITVNTITPGAPRGTAEGVAGRRPQEPADLVSTLLYVLDRGSGFLTGQTLDVSGPGPVLL
ncbi:dehydrogenase [Streptomyces zinciresistens K42]|uniref:Dehydrogenase n=1 Tax=Streptomyces zinciresistens K42 TaxID=700597 RepID=G2GFT8_9ACTN|nr:dehydrogenase [Streptomyces zinciresistens K42]